MSMCLRFDIFDATPLTSGRSSLFSRFQLNINLRVTQTHETRSLSLIHTTHTLIWSIQLPIYIPIQTDFHSEFSRFIIYIYHYILSLSDLLGVVQNNYKSVSFIYIKSSSNSLKILQNCPRFNLPNPRSKNINQPVPTNMNT